MDDRSARENRFYRIANCFHLFFLVSGLFLFIVYRTGLLGGFGLALSILSVYSFFRIKEISHSGSELISPGTDWTLLFILAIAVISLIVIKMLDGSAFYSGFSLGTALGTGMIYCLVLVKRFYDQI